FFPYVIKPRYRENSGRREHHSPSMNCSVHCSSAMSEQVRLESAPHCTASDWPPVWPGWPSSYLKRHSHCGMHVGKTAIGDLVGASTTYNVKLRHSVRMTVVTNTRLAAEAESECGSLGIEIIDRNGLGQRLRKYPILLSDVLKKANQRSSSFADGISKLEALISG